MKHPIFGVALLVLAPSLVFAQGGRAIVGAGLGATAPASVLGDAVDSSVGIDAFGSLPLTNRLSFRIGAGLDRFRPSANVRADCSAHGFDCNDRIGYADAGLEIAARESQRDSVRPFGFVEMGAYNFAQEVAVGSFKASNSGTHFGGGIGGGVRVNLTDSWGMGAELSARWWQQRDVNPGQTYWFLEPSALLYYRFRR
jgi:opacity protein-like surface antigen